MTLLQAIFPSPTLSPLLSLPSTINDQKTCSTSVLLFSSTATAPGWLQHKASKTWRRRPASACMFCKPVVKDGVLSFNGKDAITDIPDNVIVTPCSNSSLFLGATSTNTSSRHVFKLGVIQDTRLLSLFRFKIWWKIPRFGNSASDVPTETQMLLLEATEDPGSYIVFLPILDGQLRSSLQGNSADELELCVESGDPAVVASKSLKAVFVNCGHNPFALMKESMKILEQHIGSFSVRETKQMPGMLDCFGWCTWDAFYHDINPQGIKDGLESLSKGGTPARFLIIDDGWQDTTNEFQKEGEPYVEGSQFGARLVSIEANSKFHKTTNKAASQESVFSLKEFVSDIKETFGLKYVYVWHALMGYWGGLHPDAPGTQKYNPTLKFPIQSLGNLANMRDGAMDAMERYGVGTIDPAKVSEFYDDLHKYLVSQNVDGVKVDVQNILETLANDLGGRVSLTRHFQQALEKSISTNFQDNSIICCMGQSTDSLYNSKRSGITRVSDDYYPKNPTTQTLHIAAVAFNSIFFGEVIIPDWDMFYSLHDAAEFHAIARAVGGCGVYVSDKPGQHDFKILEKLVLPDGTVLRAKYPGRPTRDCLFNDPVMDGRSLLKIWNLNKCTGVIGVFNCQGAGSWPCMENATTQSSNGSPEISGRVSPADIEYLEDISGGSLREDYAVFSVARGCLFQLKDQESFEVTLKTLECDVFTVSPIKVYDEKIRFAAIGLIDMYNGGGAIEAIESWKDESSRRRRRMISIKGRGVGRFGAYSNIKPKICFVNSKQVEEEEFEEEEEEEGFEFNSEDQLLSVTIPVGGGINNGRWWDLTLCY